jgi:FAD/FMN-containing dehydrogenase
MSRQRRQFLWSTLGLGSLLLMPDSTRAQTTSARRSVDALALDGSVKSLSAGAFTDFATALRGNVLLPEDDGYDTARRLFFRDRFVRRPAFIVQATGPADVALAVTFARENNLLMSIKGGGHSDWGTSSHDQAMMLDLGLLRDVRIDPQSRRAWVAGATPSGLIDHETAPYLLATPLGGEPTVGFGGIALGGGIGKLGRAYGLTLDSVRAINLVCADGQVRRASAGENADLFWAARGGGSNFGVATAFELDLHPVPERAFYGVITFPFRQLRQVVAAYGDFSAEASEQLYVELYIDVRDTADASVLQLKVCNIGSDADAALRPLRQFGDVLHDDIRPVSFETAQNAEAIQAARIPAEGAPYDTFFRSGLLEGLEAPLASAIAESLAPEPGRRLTMLFLHAGGAISRRAPTSTAFWRRSMSHDMIFVSRWPKDATRHGEQVSQIWARLRPFTRGFYVNEMAGGVSLSETADNYGANASRLAAIKRRWDPDNFFRLNANILPAG